MKAQTACLPSNKMKTMMIIVSAYLLPELITGFSCEPHLIQKRADYPFSV
jgi:hypothetical protein